MIILLYHREWKRKGKEFAFFKPKIMSFSKAGRYTRFCVCTDRPIWLFVCPCYALYRVLEYSLGAM